MGHRRAAGRDFDRRERGPYREPYSRRDRYDDRYERYDRHDRYDRYSDRDRDPYGRDRDWRRTSPPTMRRGYSPDRRRRSYSRSPPRGTSPMGARVRDYDLPAPSASAPNGDHRW
jgi:transformer-2 protein